MNRRQLLRALASLPAAPIAAATAAPVTSPPLAASPPAPSPPIPFGYGDFAKLSAAAAGRPTIVHLWGISCAPCLVELPRWAAFLRQHPALPVVFIQCDPLPLARVSAALRRAGLAVGDQRSVTGFADERLRYEIDPTWQGELPFTLLLGTGAQTGAQTSTGTDRRTFSGSADFGQLAQWWRQQASTADRRPRG